MAEAMKLVRDSMGPDAIILSTTERPFGKGVEVRAAVDTPLPAHLESSKPPDMTKVASFPILEDALHSEGDFSPPSMGIRRAGLPSKAINKEIAQLKRAMVFHGFSRSLAKAVLELYSSLTEEDPRSKLASFLEMRFKFAALSLEETRALMLVGPPGVGKTIAVAKLAAAAVVNGFDTRIVTTDTIRSGAVEQLSSIAELMEIEVDSVSNASELKDLVGTDLISSGSIVLIDTPATNPLRSEEVDDLRRSIRAVNATPLLVLAAGGLWGDDLDVAKTFRDLGVERLILTRLDASRRLGGALSAADAAGLSLTAFSQSPYVAQALRPFEALDLADRILNFE